jgi:hypothetical protein
VTRDIRPNLTNWTATSNVPGAAFVVDGTWHTSPYSTSDEVGVQHVLTGVPAQTVGGIRYRLHGWTDGSALFDRFSNPASNATYFSASYSTDGTTWTLINNVSPSP